jgi:O-methyltransferase involved in polyketide biosynthesis
MYLRPDDVYKLVVSCAEHFPTATLLFDAVPRWFSQRRMKRWRHDWPRRQGRSR